MAKRIKFLVERCTTCKKNKYDRHPNKQEIIHVDLYSTEGKLVLKAIDKVTKLAKCAIIKSRAVEDIEEKLREIMCFFSVPEIIVIDNEKSLNSVSITSMLEDSLKIKIFKTPPYKSEVNGQIERFHSTLSEIMRCLKAHDIDRTFEELLDRSLYEYNHSVHSTTGKKPVELYFGMIPNASPGQLEQFRQTNVERLKVRQDKDHHNKKRKPIKNYDVGQVIYVKHNKRLGSKLTVRYNPETVKENRHTTVLTKSGKIIHKSNIRN